MILGSGEGACYDYLWSTPGSGGTAGQGGMIEYSSTSKIYSYNGNRITEDNFDYSKISYEYDKDGNLLDGSSGEKTIANVITQKNDESKRIIPAKIFIQDGIRRAVYDNLCYMSDERKKEYGVDGDIPLEKIKNVSKNGGTVKNVQIIEENTSMPFYQQGIGSGAGYIEVSNGTFEPITTP